MPLQQQFDIGRSCCCGSVGEVCVFFIFFFMSENNIRCKIEKRIIFYGCLSN